MSDTSVLSDRTKIGKYASIALVVGILVTLIVVFLYLDRRNEISSSIQGLGFLGMFIAIVFMAFLHLTPVPSEGLLVLYLKIYGIYLGTLIAWLGSALSTLLIFFVARYYGQRFLQKLVTPERFNMVDNWVKRKGSLGLLIARLLPIPAFMVNYIAGVIPSVRFWPYVWTGALSIIPYYVGTALVFLGVSRAIWVWLIVGGIMIIAFWSLGYMFNRRLST
ncbi:VTT domain-containing protein [Paradesulfitobacterium aromaticivorans]